MKNLKFDFTKDDDFQRWNNLTDEEHDEWRANYCTQEDWNTLMQRLFSRS